MPGESSGDWLVIGDWVTVDERRRQGPETRTPKPATRNKRSGPRSPKRFVIEVPATSGNLGPGFDVAGMALSVYNRVEVDVEAGGLAVIEVFGEGAQTLPRDDSNIVLQAMKHVFHRAHRAFPPVRLRLLNRIPMTRGLGSSAAARVAGVVAANELLGRSLSVARMLAVATELEGHPDNVAPALLGGVVLSSLEPDGSVTWDKLTVRRPPRLVVLIPQVEVSTARARAVLPRVVPLPDAVFNVGRTALLIAGLTAGRDDLLQAALQDRLHQPYRSKLMPWLPDCIAAAVRAGALGATLSGAGSSMLAMTRSDPAQVGRAMLRILRRSGVDGTVRHVRISRRGARVIR